MQLACFGCEMEDLEGQSCTLAVSFHIHVNLRTNEEKVALVEALIWGWEGWFCCLFKYPCFPKENLSILVH